MPNLNQKSRFMEDPKKVAEQRHDAAVAMQAARSGCDSHVVTVAM